MEQVVAQPWWMLFVFGSVWFWILIAVVNIILFACIENTRGFLASFMTLITLGLVQFLGDIPIFPTIFNDPWGSLMWAGLYLFTGTVLSIAWWFFYCRRQYQKYMEMRDKFCAQHHLNSAEDIPAAFVERWEKRTSGLELPPLAKDHKEHIYMWIAWWPWRLVWAFLSDFIISICRRIYNGIAGVLRLISEWQFSNVHKDFKKDGQ